MRRFDVSKVLFYTVSISLLFVLSFVFGLYWGANNCEGEDKWKMDELKPGITNTVKSGASLVRKLWERRKQW